MGYRFYDKAGVPVRWPFGFGLSYTSFAYSGLTVSGDTVCVTVKNTGVRAGSEVVQLYIEPPTGGLHRPVRELKGFCKVFLRPGESETVTFALDERAFAIWQDGWQVPGGRYTVRIGGLSAAIEKTGEELAAPAWQAGSWYENCVGKPRQKEWEAILGRSYAPKTPQKGSFTMDNTVEEMKDASLVMRLFYGAVENTIARSFDGKKDYGNPEFRMLMASSVGSPLRSMQISGGMKDGLMQGLLEMANGHYLRGILRMVRGG